MAEINPSSVCFGVEIECGVPRDFVNTHEIEIGDWHRGIELPSWDTHEDKPLFPANWRIERDSSVRNFPREFHPVEIVSPILSGHDGLTQLRYVLSVLTEIGADVNVSCGAHIHLGVKSIMEQIDQRFSFDVPDDPSLIDYLVKLIQHFSKYEAALYAIGNSLHRLNNGYAVTIKRQVDSDHIADSISNLRGNKYVTLNLRNVWNRGTVENRQFAPTLNADKWTGYVTSYIALAQKAAEGGTNYDARVYRDEDWYESVLLMQRDFLWSRRQTDKRYGWDEVSWNEWGESTKNNQRHQASRFNSRAPLTENRTDNRFLSQWEEITNE